MIILCKYERKKKCFFVYLFAFFFFRKCMFCVQLYGKWTSGGRYNLYFEALKGLLLKKRNYFFFSIFANIVAIC